jgi:hypothetical protein
MEYVSWDDHHMHETGPTRLFLVVPGSYFVPEVDPFQAYLDILYINSI